MDAMCRCTINPEIKPITLQQHFRNNWRKIIERSSIALIICGLIILMGCMNDARRIPIQEATIQQLDECQYVGPELAIQIFKFVHSPEYNGDITTLEQIPGIGPQRMDLIIKNFR